jgi:hypothetical protein
MSADEFQAKFDKLLHTRNSLVERSTCLPSSNASYFKTIILVTCAVFHMLLSQELEHYGELQKQISWGELSKAVLYKCRVPGDPGD